MNKIEQKKFKLSKSIQMYKRSMKSLAGGISSAMRSVQRPVPLFFEQGKGSKIYDVDGNKYIDYTLSFGPLILGHSHQNIVSPVIAQLKKGWIYGAQHELEIKLSEKLRRIIPCAELVRYSNTGSEAIHTVIRLARAYTGKNKVIKFEGHYHGWFDNILINYHPSLELAGNEKKPVPVLESDGQPKSVLEDIIVLPWNNFDILRETITQYKNQIACVITEPVMCNSGVIFPKDGYLKSLREITKENNIILIFDEVITGFRLALGGAQEYFGIIPDLAVFGKAMADGFPISCIVGKKEIMNLIADKKVVHAGTFNSNPISVTAAYATITELQKDNRKIYKHIYSLGKKLIDGINKIIQELKFDALIQGPGPMFHLFFTDRNSVTDYREYTTSDMETYSKFAEIMLGKGILILNRGIWYISAKHTKEDINFTIKAVRKSLVEIQR